MSPGVHAYNDDDISRKHLGSLPEALNGYASIRVHLIRPLGGLSAYKAKSTQPPATHTSSAQLGGLSNDHWKVLDAPLPEPSTIQETKRVATSYFETSVEAIFLHVSQNAQKYPSATQVEANGNPAPIHLPALLMNDRYYQVSTSSSQTGTYVRIQRVQPGTKQDAVGDAIGRLSTAEFDALMSEPEKLQAVFDEALAEGQMMLLQTPAGEVIVIGGDDFEKRLEAKDEPYLLIIRKTTELIKNYIDEVERLPINVETLLDKRRALSQQILARQAIELAGDTTRQRSALRDVVGYLGRVLTNKP